MEITIFTPTFNRATTLPKLYKSICEQTFSDFEWVIVDDGSQDNTENLVLNWINENLIKIRYYKQINSGKHVAINAGVQYAKGDLFFIVDSDDQIVHDGLSVIHELYKTSQITSDKYAGIAGTKIHTNGDPIGTMFTNLDYVDCTTLERNQNKITGDKAEVFFTAVLRRYPFPVFEGEKFLNEAVVWNRIARDRLLIRWYDIPLIMCEYLEGGLTNNKNKLQENNPQGMLLYVKELIESDKKVYRKIAHQSTYCGIAHRIYSNEEICKQLSIRRFSMLLYDLIYKIRGNN